jgi:cysteine desulfuration protein SufE
LSSPSPTAASCPAKLIALLDDFDLLADRAERVDALIGISGRFHAVPETIAARPFSEDHKVPGCESQAYVWARPEAPGTLRFYFAVENPQGLSAKAMAVILDETCSGAPVAEVASVSGDIVYRVFGAELSMGKTMGLMGLVAMVQNYAKRAQSAGLADSR